MMTTKTTRVQAGRETIYEEAMPRRSFRLSEAHMDFLRGRGDGDASVGLRKILDHSMRVYNMRRKAKAK